MNQQLIDYINKQLKKGTSDEAIKKALLGKGWQTKDIEDNFNEIKKPTKPITKKDPAFFVPTQATPITPTTTTTDKPIKKSKKLLIIIILVILAVLLAGGGAFAYFYYFSPEKIAQRVFNNITNIKSLEYSGEIKIETKLADPKDLLGPFSSLIPTSSNSIIKFSGSSDIADINKTKNSFTLNIQTDILAPQNLALGFESMNNDEYLFAQITELPDLGFDLTSFKNQWVKFSIKDAKQAMDLNTTSSEVLSREQLDKLELAWLQNKVLQLGDKLPSEKIDGADTYHYAFEMNKTAFKKFVTEANLIIEKKAMTPEQITSLDKDLKDIQMPTGEFWIGKKDLLPHKTVTNLTFKDPENPKNYAKITITLFAKNFNKPVVLKLPEQTQTVEEFTQKIYSIFPGGNSTSTMPFSFDNTNKKPIACGIDPECLEGYGCDLEAGIISGDCTFLNIQHVDPNDKKDYTKKYSCKSLKPGICRTSRSTVKIIDGYEINYIMNNNKLIEMSSVHLKQ